MEGVAVEGREVYKKCDLRFMQLLNEFRFNSGSGQIWLDDLHCTASDTSLISCRHREVGTHSCGHYEDIAVYCNSKYNALSSST